jgi:hypothetical protein
MYEVNCAWYPKFCTHELKITSFPYTAIYDENGELNNKIVGFYPENVIRDVFEQIETANEEIKRKTKSSLNSETEKTSIEVA